MNNAVGDEIVDYTLETILLFLQLKSSSHPVYVKKLKQQFPGRTIVPMDHRIKLIEYIEDPEELRLEVCTSFYEFTFSELFGVPAESVHQILG